MSAVSPLPDLVRVHVTADLPIRSEAMPFADRVEIRFGKAFPVVLVVEKGALGRLVDAIQDGRDALNAAAKREPED